MSMPYQPLDFVDESDVKDYLVELIFWLCIIVSVKVDKGRGHG
jgi:hypothetical protein